MLAFIKGRKTNVSLDEQITNKLIHERVKIGFDSYLNTIMNAKNYVESAGGHFFHFLQPSLVSSPPLSSYQKQLIEQLPHETRIGIDAFSKGYNLYKEEYNSVKTSINGENMTEYLRPKNGTEYFWDYIHVSSKGNKIIALAILNSINEILKF